MKKSQITKITITEQEKNGFAESFRELRQNYNVSLRHIEEYTEIPNPTLSRYENNINEPTLIQALKIAKFFNVTIDEMIYGTWDEDEIYARIQIENEKRERENYEKYLEMQNRKKIARREKKEVKK